MKITEEYYLALGIPEETILAINKELCLITLNKLSSTARPLRIEMLQEAIGWPRGKDQAHRITTEIYKSHDFVVAVGKPGKEAAPDFKRKHYKTGKITNNKNDMNPFIMQAGVKIGKDLTFGDMFEQIGHLMRADIFGLEIFGMLIYRMAFVLDHMKNKENKWRYVPPKISLAVLKKRLPEIEGIPIDVYLYFLDVLALNEDVKMHTMGHENAEGDYGRINTLLTFANLVAVLLNRRSLAKFFFAFAYPPFNRSPLPKIKSLFETFPTLSPVF